MDGLLLGHCPMSKANLNHCRYMVSTIEAVHWNLALTMTMSAMTLTLF